MFLFFIQSHELGMHCPNNIFMFFSTDQTYLNCINNTRVICGTESRRLNFNVDTSEIKADMSFNKCGELLRKPVM